MNWHKHPAKLAVERRKRDELRATFECWNAGWADCEKGKPCAPPSGYDEEEAERYRTGYVACCRETAKVNAALDEIRALPSATPEIGE